MKPIRRIIGLVVCMASVPALAVSTSHWTHQNEADFKAGTLHNVVVTNQGDVKLSRAIVPIVQQDPNVTTVNALAQTEDGTIYAATGPKGILLTIKDDKIIDKTTIPGAVNVQCVLLDSNGAIVVGTDGAKGKVLRIDKPGAAPREIFSEKDVQYVWSITQTADGNLYAATGPNGQVFEIKPDGSHSQLYKSSEDNITSLVSDGKDLLYLGTDPDGQVVRVNRQTRESFILYNAGESEISALALDNGGNLYAATGEVSDKQQAPSTAQETREKSGRPEGATGAPIPPTPVPAPPKPPSLPNPGPGEPKPIPKKASLVPATQPVMMDDNPGGGGGDNGNGGDNGGPGGDNNGPDTDQGQNPGARPNGGMPTPPQNPNEQQPSGNAIYKIDPAGFVTEVFRQDVTIYSMIAQKDVLLVGTGDDGDVYQVNPATEETEVLATTNAKEVTCMLPARDGRILLGLANAGGMSAMTGGYASDGTYISSVLDADQVARFGKMQLHGQLPDGTTLKVARRSGNVKDADAEGWSKWTDDVDAAQYMDVPTPAARFLQYRLTFSTKDPSKTPLVDLVDVAYQLPNMAPVIKSVKIGAEAPAQGQQGQTPAPGAAPAKPSGTGTQTITWDASDPNNDTLTYSLYFRLESSGPWILLKDKLKDATFEWDTRTVADGRYQIKVVASDAPSNPPGTEKISSRVSDYYVVDNTPPAIGDINTQITGQDVKITFRAEDETSVVASVEYAVDSNDQWQTALPVDGIFDSPDKTVSFSLKGLTAGTHQVTIRATDSKGNQGLRTITVKIQG